MAVFRVGMRVRIVGCTLPSNRYIVGMESVIVAPRKSGYALAIHPLADGSTWIRPENLEPILPEGHRAGDYSNVRDLMDSLQGVRA